MKIFLNNSNESWIVDRFVEEFSNFYPDLITSNIKEADIIWIISPWTWRKISKKELKLKKVICTIHHIDFDKFEGKEGKEFYKLDKFVNHYHAISKITKSQLRKITDKQIVTLPFWVNQNIWYDISNKKNIREKYGFSSTDYLVGSFQRDTEGKDLTSPKLIKGPDIFLNIVKKINDKNKNLKIVLTGKRRDYLINNFQSLNLPFRYFEMVDLASLNELYNILDLYIVTSRVEGGPQAILECALSKTPIVSTNVGIASEILDSSSIFEEAKFATARPNVNVAFKNSIQYTIPKGMEKFVNMFKNFYEN